MRGRLRVWLVMRRIIRVPIEVLVVCRRGLVELLAKRCLPVFFSYMEALYVRPGLTFELAPGFVVGT